MEGERGREEKKKFEFNRKPLFKKKKSHAKCTVE